MFYLQFEHAINLQKRPLCCDLVLSNHDYPSQFLRQFYHNLVSILTLAYDHMHLQQNHEKQRYQTILFALVLLHHYFL